MRKTFFLALLSVSARFFAQQDTITIDAKLTQNNSVLTVNQTIEYTNHLQAPINKIKLLNWLAAYDRKYSALANRKLEDRKNDLYFAKDSQLGGLETLTVNDAQISGVDDENIFIPLKESLKPGEKTTLKLQYTMKLPDIAFTGYGTSDKKTVLKYFFIVPDGFETQDQSEKNYIDIEETESGGNFWKISLNTESQAVVQSNMQEISENHFEGKLSQDPEFSITPTKFPPIIANVAGQTVTMETDYEIPEKTRQNLEFYLPLQLEFLKQRTGFLPNKIFITEKFKNKEDFFGNDDIKFWKLRFQLFTEKENTDLDYLSIISKKVVESSFITDKNTDHWLVNGIKTYLEMEYLRKFYPDRKLLGDLPENVKIFGLKPLKRFNAAKINLTERYGVAYQYILSQNADQKIGEEYKDLANLNQMIISNFETGTLLHFVAEKMTYPKFEGFLVKYLSARENKRLDTQDFLKNLSIASKGSSRFIADYLQRKSRVNFKLKKFKKTDSTYEVKVAKNTEKQIPFKLETKDSEQKINSYWFDTASQKGSKEYEIPQSYAADKLTINDGYTFPESNLRDNYLYTKGFFANMKKIKLKTVKDIPNPEYNEIYVSPRINFNAYDKVLLGLNFKNYALFDRKFAYTFAPMFSTGTKQIVGSGTVSYSFQPAEAFFRSLTLGVSGSTFHYDYDLGYQKITAFTNISFTKEPRSTESKFASFSWNHVVRDLSPKMIAENEYDRYNLWNLGAGYSDNRLIHEKYFSTNLQAMKDFSKLSAEAFYRWEYAKDKKISFRLFGGYFFNNHTRNSLFDYGISRISNYSFSYGLIGQSATTGVLSQQYILADGGFKTLFENTANEWITSFNIDSHVWRWFNVYADAGVYKNKEVDPKFIWDSGVKLKVIPDFFEVYFPIQSSLGFEPKFKDYGQRIRFTLILNFNAAISYFRRGWF